MERYYQRLIAHLRTRFLELFGVVNKDGTIIACSDEARIGRKLGQFRMGQGLFRWDEYTCYTLETGSAAQEAVFIRGTDKNSIDQVTLIASFFDMMTYENEKNDTKADLIRKIIFGEAGERNLYTRLRESGINYLLKYTVMVFRSSLNLTGTFYNLIESYLYRRNTDFLITGENDEVILVAAMRDEEYAKIEETVTNKAEDIERQYHVELYAGIGSLAEDVTELRSSYLSALRALRAAEICLPEKRIMCDGHTGFAGLLGDVSAEAGRSFLKQVFPDGMPEDEELLFTVKTYIEHDFSIPETADLMYVNRNTVNYRLSKFQKDTGLDLKKAEDAMLFKAALMIERKLNRKGDK